MPRLPSLHLLVLTACAPSGPSPPPLSLPTSEPPPAAPMAPTAEERDPPTDACRYDVTIERPHLDLPDPDVEKRVTAIVDQRVTQFGDFLSGEIESSCEDGVLVGAAKELSIHCEVPFASPRFVSVACDGYAFTGGAHPSKSARTINLELPSCRDVHLADLFIAGTAWRHGLEDLAATELTRVINADGDPSDPAAPWLGSLESFAVSPEGMTFYFEDDVPFVLGSVHPLVRWRLLAPYLRHDRAAVFAPPP